MNLYVNSKYWYEVQRFAVHQVLWWNIKLDAINLCDNNGRIEPTREPKIDIIIWYIKWIDGGMSEAELYFGEGETDRNLSSGSFAYGI